MCVTIHRLRFDIWFFYHVFILEKFFFSFQSGKIHSKSLERISNVPTWCGHLVFYLKLWKCKLCHKLLCKIAKTAKQQRVDIIHSLIHCYFVISKNLDVGVWIFLCLKIVEAVKYDAAYDWLASISYKAHEAALLNRCYGN